jgi:hypothetical protein
VAAERWDPVLHEQHSDAATSVTSVSGTVAKFYPWVREAPCWKALYVPLARTGRPAPLAPAGMEHEHVPAAAACWASLLLRPVWAKAMAESPRKTRVCFILVE